MSVNHVTYEAVIVIPYFENLNLVSLVIHKKQVMKKKEKYTVFKLVDKAWLSDTV